MEKELIGAARQAWLAADDFRRKRERYKKYTYGEQWDDIIRGRDGRQLTESEVIHMSGKQPYTNNLIRQLVKTIIGRYRRMSEQRGYYKDTVAQSDSSCQLSELDARLLEEFLISGMAVQRVTADGMAKNKGVKVENVNPCDFFVNHTRDPAGRDIELIGQCRDMSLPEVLDRFGHGEVRRIAWLQSIYAGRDQLPVSTEYTEIGRADDTDFFTAAPGKCRVIELWTIDAVQRLICSDPESDTISYRPIDDAADIVNENMMRQSRGKRALETTSDIEFCWNCRWLSPWGDLLDSAPSTLHHRRHPYIMRLYPLTDGEIHPFVEDIIDQQRLINRLIMMIDKMMATAAKGVLLFPLSQLPENVSLHEVSDTWARADGVIPITGRGSEPHQVVTTTDGVGAYRMLELQMKLFDNISGVGEVLQGRQVSGNMGVSAYESQIENATIALSDLLETFGGLVRERNGELQSYTKSNNKKAG